jgi:hypothetical protein
MYTTLTYTILAVIFCGSGIGILISPAFVPKLAIWNLLGFPSVFIGAWFISKSLGRE